ncbi:hypothetical protein N8D56_22280 [Devosia sp. A8/3-2]|nr:hypothetical protein N8D56_22280 [Devosia sp. A8/3-2]
MAEYFSKVGLTNAEISELLVYGDENRADAAATAENFLKTKEDLWTSWVSPRSPKRSRQASKGRATLIDMNSAAGLQSGRFPRDPQACLSGALRDRAEQICPFRARRK